MSHVPDEHRSAARRQICCAVLTVSDTRTLENDRGGAEVVEQLIRAGHRVAERSMCADEPESIGRHVQRWVGALDVDVILITGGTGISERDITYEKVRSLLTKELPGYGELFRWLSYQEIGAASMLSRAIGGLVGSTALLTMPGSPSAVALAMQKVILPELGHLVQQATKS